MAGKKTTVKKSTAKKKGQGGKTRQVAKKVVAKAARRSPVAVMSRKVKEPAAAPKKAISALHVVAANPMSEDGDNKVRTKVTKAQLLAREELNRLTKKWESLNKKSKSMKAEAYNMRKAFQAKTAIEHKVLGWGFILDNKNDRLEVLFRDGIRYLISNYKA